MTDRKAPRPDRLAEALRANLRRRKAAGREAERASATLAEGDPATPRDPPGRD